MERKYIFRAQVVKNDPMTNPENGWVEGYYYEDLCLDKDGKPVMKSFIRSGEMIWEVKPETLGQLLGTNAFGQKVFEGDMVMLSKDIVSVIEWNQRNMDYVIHSYILHPVERKGEDLLATSIPVGFLFEARIIGNIHTDNVLK